MWTDPVSQLGRRLAVSALLVVAAVAVAEEAGTPTDPAVALGRLIYDRGEGDGREITAVLGGPGGAEVPASALPCGSCHGARGEGGTEGGVSPTNITWPALTRPYGVRSPSGRERPAYDASKLKRAIGMGVDAAGNDLHVAMPRYQLTHAEADALVAYLKHLGTLDDPGVTDDALVFGALLPPVVGGDPRAEGIGRAVRGILDAYFDEINERGGIYGRRLELVALVPETGEPAARRRTLEVWLTEQPVFALVAPFLVGADAELASVAAARGLPMIAPFSLEPQTAFPLNRHVFYTLSGFAEQARALVDVARGQLPGAKRVAVVHLPGAAQAHIADAVVEQAVTFGTEGWQSVVREPIVALRDPAALAARLRAAGTDVLFFFGGDADARSLIEAASALAWHPMIALLGPMVGAEPLTDDPAWAGKLLVSLPSSPADQRPAAMAAWQRLRSVAGLDQAGAGVPAVEIASLVAAALTFEGLETVGRDVTRKRLVDTLEALYRFETGLTPNLTYDANRRIGALGAYVLTLDETAQHYTPGGSWADAWVTPQSR